MIPPEKNEYFDLETIVNGKSIKRKIVSHLRLLDFLRDDLRLTGAKEVCSEGECGACTILMDGITVNSCLVLAAEAHGKEIITAEGLNNDKLKKAFEDKHAVQCGYCIPGMMLSADSLLKENENPDREEIKHGLAGNICRCTGYRKIIDAVESAGREE